MKFFIASLIFLFWVTCLQAATLTQTVFVPLSWTDTSDNEDGFSIYQCVGFGPCTPVTKLGFVIPANVNSFQDQINNDPGGRTICYAISAFNISGESIKSNTACITTPVIVVIPVKPNAPTGAAAKVGNVIIGGTP